MAVNASELLVTMLASNLKVISGISKKSGKRWERVVLKSTPPKKDGDAWGDVGFDNSFVAAAKLAGAQYYDLAAKKPVVDGGDAFDTAE